MSATEAVPVAATENSNGNKGVAVTVKKVTETGNRKGDGSSKGIGIGKKVIVSLTTAVGVRARVSVTV